MKNLTENMREVRVLLDDLFREIKPVIDGSLPKEKEEQLKALEKAYGHYLNAGKPVPLEFQDIKNRFQHELELMALARKEYPGFFNFLQEKLNEVPLGALIEKKKMSKAEALYQASLQPDFLKKMINKGDIKPGASLEPKNKNKKYKARILESGKIEIQADDKIQQFDDVHSAAAYVAEKEENGLNFWKVKHPIDGTLVKLSIFLRL